MTDQTIPAGLTRAEAQKMREWAERALTVWASDQATVQAARVLLEMFPPPPRPTLADMTGEERHACLWMQCDVEGRDGEWVVAGPSFKEGFWRVMSEVASVRRLPTSTITPRPDLPRMEWPAGVPVPPNTLTEGSQWDDGDKLSRACDASGRDQIVVTDKEGDVSVWGQNAGWWEGSTPTVGYEPFTIMHAGRKADQ